MKVASVLLYVYNALSVSATTASSLHLARNQFCSSTVCSRSDSVPFVSDLLPTFLNNSVLVLIPCLPTHPPTHPYPLYHMLLWWWLGILQTRGGAGNISPTACMQHDPEVLWSFHFNILTLVLTLAYSLHLSSVGISLEFVRFFHCFALFFCKSVNTCDKCSWH